MSFKAKLAAAYAVDLDLEENGKWCEFEGFELKIRRLSSKQAQKAREEASKKYQQDIQRDKLSDAAAEEILNKQICFGIIADWRGDVITDDEGKAIPFSPDTAMEMFSGPEMKELKTQIVQLSMQSATYKKEADEEAVKN
jgi:hypothetical protein